MLRIFSHALLLCTFLLYSQSMLVVWGLYMIEKQDIVLYYETADDASDGMHFMHKLCDAQKGEHDGALSLLKVLERSLPFAQSHVCIELHTAPRSLVTQHLDAAIPHQPNLSSVFRPPCC